MPGLGARGHRRPAGSRRPNRPRSCPARRPNAAPVEFGPGRALALPRVGNGGGQPGRPRPPRRRAGTGPSPPVRPAGPGLPGGRRRPAAAAIVRSASAARIARRRSVAVVAAVRAAATCRSFSCCSCSARTAAASSSAGSESACCPGRGGQVPGPFPGERHRAAYRSASADNSNQVWPAAPTPRRRPPRAARWRSRRAGGRGQVALYPGAVLEAPLLVAASCSISTRSAASSSASSRSPCVPQFGLHTGGPPGHFGLPAQRLELPAQLAGQVGEPGQVGLHGVELAERLLLALAVLEDAGGLLDEGAPVLRASLTGRRRAGPDRR